LKKSLSILRAKHRRIVQRLAGTSTEHLRDVVAHGVYVGCPASPQGVRPDDDGNRLTVASQGYFVAVFDHLQNPG
jgi:hypothetical protein